jgi:hypothetical protein
VAGELLPPTGLVRPRCDEIISTRLERDWGIWRLVLTGTRPSGLLHGRAYFVEFRHEHEARQWLNALKP